jgi:peptide/nickel transport system substrate-binding protein
MGEGRLPAGEPEGQAGVSRRQLLQGAVGAGGFLVAGGALAACGGSTVSSSSSSAGGSTVAASSVDVQSVTNEQASSATTPAKSGGHFRLGVTGGGAKDIIDGQQIVTKPDQARLVAGFEGLLFYDENYELQPNLATEVTQDAPDQYTIVLREGVEFHNGKPLTPEDVIFSLQRIVDPKLGLFGLAGLSSIDPKGITKVDAKTVRMKLKNADSTIRDQLGTYTNGIVPVGYTRSGPQVGTGPYKLQSFKPGQQSVHVKNPNYWREGEPSFDQVSVIDFNDAAAQVNALLAGQVDAMTDVPFAQVQVVKGHSGLAVLESQGGGWVPLCMAIDKEPFTDVRVRQAFRLIVDRQAMVEQVLSGHGRVANDLYGIFDAGYLKSAPQRQKDIAKAKSLLAAAGKSNLTVDLHTTDGAAGMVDVAKVFAQQAKEAGVTVNVKVDANYYGDQYLKLPFSVDFWGTRSYLAQVGSGSLPGSPYNETHWPPKSSNFVALYKQALGAADEATANGIKHQMQQLEYDEGGYIIPFFNNLVDGYSTKVQGFQPSKGTLNLDSFGHGFRSISFS